MRGRCDGGAGVKFGVVRFPGSCDEVDALRARRAGRRGGAAVARRPRPAGRRRGHRARRLLLRRLPARRRDRPLRAGDGGGRGVRRARAGSVLGICNGFQVLCEARPAARARCCRTRRCSSSSARSTSRSSTPTPPSRARARPASALSIPVKHTTGRFYAPEEELDRLEAPARSCSATRRARTRTARCATSPACRNEARQRVRADAASRARRRPADRSTDGLKIFESMRAQSSGERGASPA